MQALSFDLPVARTWYVRRKMWPICICKCLSTLSVNVSIFAFKFRLPAVGCRPLALTKRSRSGSDSLSKLLLLQHLPSSSLLPSLKSSTIFSNPHPLPHSSLTSPFRTKTTATLLGTQHLRRSLSGARAQAAEIRARRGRIKGGHRGVIE
jgi:hypothetical protein